jgi:nucleoside 2-deoxyribosyltransferase
MRLVSPEAIEYFAEYWIANGHLEAAPNRAINETASLVRLTVDGWNSLDPIAVGGIPGRVFVAMSFNPELDSVYEDAIQMAIERDCGMKATRIDREHFPEQISDRILAELRRCQILVADFTDHKAGVYFEAGFALALGRTVVWTCREDCIGGAHFDTRQYPHILWRNPAELRRKLADRIQAMTARHLS